MAVNPPVHQIIHSDLTTQKGKKQLADLLNQIYVTLGSGEDIVGNSESLSSTISSRLNARINDVEDKLDIARAELNTIRSLLRGSISELQEQECEMRGIKTQFSGRLNEALDKIEELEGLL